MNGYIKNIRVYLILVGIIITMLFVFRPLPTPSTLERKPLVQKEIKVIVEAKPQISKQPLGQQQTVLKQELICPNCRKSIEKGWAKCFNCGISLDTQQKNALIENQTCPGCGKFLLNEWNRCSYCGKDLRG